jgi:hypothetical protein
MNGNSAKGSLIDNLLFEYNNILATSSQYEMSGFNNLIELLAELSLIIGFKMQVEK